MLTEMSSSNNAGSYFSSWLASLYDCFSSPEEERRRYSRRIGSYATTTLPHPWSRLLTKLGVEREMKICHNQPHLVPPMKLVVYDDMPSTLQAPAPSHLSQLVAQGRNLASRASSISVRRRPSARPGISGPLPVQPADGLPFRRRYQYRPLELSIYLPDNRLSDLPDFDVADFDAAGRIQLPAKALVRAKSEACLEHPRTPAAPVNTTTSMVGERHLGYWQSPRASSVVSTSRPASAHDTFHSHPVVWNTLPGIPAQAHSRYTDQATGITVLSPMREDFTPVESPDLGHMANPVGMEEEMLIHKSPSQKERGPSEIQRPFKLNNPPTSQSYRTRSRSHSRGGSLSRTRVSQWLSRSASESKPTQFYQCAVTPPQHPHSHSHTQSASTISTSILSSPESASSSATLTTAPTAPSQRSRSTTVKSFGNSFGVAEEHLTAYVVDGNGIRPETIPFTVPAIGVAF